MIRQTVLLWTLLATVIGGASYTLYSPTVLSWVWDQARAAAPGNLTAERVSGRIAGPIRIEGLAWQAPGFDLHIETFRLTWNPATLLLARGHIREVALSGVRIRLPEAESEEETDDPPAEEGGSFGLPFGLQVDSIRVRDARIRPRPEAPPVHLEHLDGSGAYGLGGWRWRADAHATWTSLASMAPQAPPAPGSLSVSARGTGQEASTEVSGELTLPDQPTLYVDGQARASLADTRIHIGGLRVTAQDRPEGLTAGGDVSLAEGPRLNLRGEWRDVAVPYFEGPGGTWTLAGTPTDLHWTVTGRANDGELRSTGHWQGGELATRLTWADMAGPTPEGRLTASGTPADYHLHLTGRARPPRGPELDLDTRIRGDMESAAVEALEVRSPEGGRLNGTGRVAWAPALAAEADLTGRGLDPGQWLADWPGRLALQTTVRAHQSAEGWQVPDARVRVHGRLRARPLELRAAGSGLADQMRLETLIARSGESRLSASGELADGDLDFQWRLRSPDLSDIHPDLAGQMEGDGTLRGGVTEPRVTVGLEANGLAFAGTAMGGLRLSANGTPAAHELTLAADHPQGKARLALSGSWRPEEVAWQFRLTEGLLDPARFPAWRLTEPADGRLSAETGELEEACWSDTTGAICLAGRYGTDPQAEAAVRVSDFPLDYALPLMPAGTAINGRADSRARLALARNGSVSGKLRLDTHGAQILTAQDNGEMAPLFDVTTLRAAAEADGQTVTGNAEMALADGGRARLHLDLEQGAGAPARWPLAAELDARFPQAGVVAGLIPAVGKMAGSAHARLTAEGPLASPQPGGEAEVALEELTLPDHGLLLTDVGLDLIPEGPRRWRVAGKARSGPGHLAVTGNADLSGPKPAAQARIQGEDFLVSNTPELRLRLSPDLDLDLADGLLTATGEVRLPWARILPPSGASQGVAESPDAVIASQGEPRQKGLKVRSAIQVIFGDEVRFEGYGLETRLEGALSLHTAPGELTTASGEVRTADGRYQAYGQDLTIERGRVLFGGGPITAPGIDVRAMREPRPDIRVGVEARGPLREPDVSLVSDPDMPQSEQLAWLVLGRPLEDTSGGESDALTQAAIMLGLKGGGKLAEIMEGETQLDTVAVEQETTAEGRQAALVVGKYLSPRLYVSYGVGLLQPVNTLRLRYQLSDHWTLVTESSAVDSGGDLFYVIESGK